MPYSPGAQGALLAWVNIFPVSTPAKSMTDLADGITLSEVLHEIDPSYDTSELDTNLGSSKRLSQTRNLQSVYKGLKKYIKSDGRECKPLIMLFDFNDVVENPDAAGLSELVALFLATAVFTSNIDKRSSLINKLQRELGPVEQAELGSIIQEKQAELELAKANSPEENSLGEARDRDPDLEDEEERVRLAAKLDKKERDLFEMTKKRAEVQMRLSHLQDKHVELQAKLAEVEGQLDDAKKLHGADESQQVQVLQLKIEEQANLIASQEEKIDTYQTRQGQLEAEVERLRISADESEKYKERCDDLYQENQSLRGTANAVNHYKQKLKENRDHEQEIARLQHELHALKEVDDRLQKALKDNDHLRKCVEENQAAMVNSEQNLQEVRLLGATYQQANEALVAENDELRRRVTANEINIQQLQETGAVDEMPRPSSPGSAADVSLGNLEQELQQTTNDFSKVQLLEAEIEVLRHGAAASTGADDLRRDLDRMKLERDSAIKMYEAIFEKLGVPPEQIENATGEGLVKGLTAAPKHGPLASLTSDFYRHVAFQNMREASRKTQQELDELRTKILKVEEAVKDKDREILAMKTDCALLDDPRYSFPGEDDDYDAYNDYGIVNAVGEDRIGALERLKQSDQLIAASLRAELEALRARYTTLEVENNIHKGQLLEALVAKEKLFKERDLAEPAASSETTTTADPAAEADVLKSKFSRLLERAKQQNEVNRTSFLVSITEKEPSGSFIPTLALPPSVVVHPDRLSADEDDGTAAPILRQVTPPPEMVAFQRRTVQAAKENGKRRRWLGILKKSIAK